MLVAIPADPVILDGATFRDAVQRAAALAESWLAVTFSITPDSPETGYGYIQRGAAMPGGAGRVRTGALRRKAGPGGDAGRSGFGRIIVKQR